MGYRFTSSTWRAPIQLIDSWLPDPVVSEPPRCQDSRVLQLLSRAGWLRRSAAQPTPLAPVASAHPAAPSAAPSRPCHVRILHTQDASGRFRPDARLVISGRINDVCAELDRLASQEMRPTQPR